MDILLGKKDKNWYMSMLLSAAVFFTPLRSMLIALGNQFRPGVGRYLSIISILLFLLILLVPSIKRFTITKDFMLWYAFAVVSWIISWVFHTEYTKQWIGEGVDIFIHAIPYYMIVQSIRDWKEAKRILYKSARITVLLMLLYTLLELIQEALFVTAQYNQFSGIILAGAATLCVIAFLEEKKLKDFIFSGAAIGMLILFGARMPIVCILGGILLYILEIIIRKKNYVVRTSKRSVYVLLLCVCVFIVFAVGIWFLMSDGMENLGKGQRILWQIANGEFFKSSGRMATYQAAVRSIIERPLLGYGIIAERMQIALRYEHSIDGFLGHYAHNLFLELLMQYGILLGGLLIILIMAVCFKLFIGSVESEKKIIAIWAIAMTFGILMLSGPVFSNKHFWIMMGMGLGYKTKERKCLKKILISNER